LAGELVSATLPWSHVVSHEYFRAYSPAPDRRSSTRSTAIGRPARPLPLGRSHSRVEDVSGRRRRGRSGSPRDRGGPGRIEHLVRKMHMHSFWPLGVIGLSAINGIEMASMTSQPRNSAFRCGSCWGPEPRLVRVYTHFRRGKSGLRSTRRTSKATCQGSRKRSGFEAAQRHFDERDNNGDA
jgi:hypothetical protein